MTTNMIQIEAMSSGEFLQTLRMIIKEELSLLDSKGKSEEDSLLSIEQLVNYLPEKPARQTVYGWVNTRRVPYEKYGKR
ncbi:MAG: hypothetical protein GYA51_12810, partial [Candidatus Methanofastidiosa archaeon]|nr:hypothetical protein [Candidatus Methanofastidiosa archaeon]